MNDRKIIKLFLNAAKEPQRDRAERAACFERILGAGECTVRCNRPRGAGTFKRLEFEYEENLWIEPFISGIWIP